MPCDQQRILALSQQHPHLPLNQHQGLLALCVWQTGSQPVVVTVCGSEQCCRPFVDTYYERQETKGESTGWLDPNESTVEH